MENTIWCHYTLSSLYLDANRFHVTCQIVMNCSGGSIGLCRPSPNMAYSRDECHDKRVMSSVSRDRGTTFTQYLQTLSYHSLSYLWHWQQKTSEYNLNFMYLSVQRIAWYLRVQISLPLYFWSINYSISILVRWLVSCELTETAIRLLHPFSVNWQSQFSHSAILISKPQTTVNSQR